MESQYDKLPIMISPFEYNPEEWTDRPKIWLDRFVYQNKLDPYDITYKSIDLEGSEGYLATLILNEREFTLGSYYRSVSGAQANVIILALLNITGYCETAAELQMLLTDAIRKGTFATQHKSRENQVQSRNEPFISSKEIKEKVKLVLQYSDDEYISIGEMSNILRDEYGINVSKRSIKAAWFCINRDKMDARTHSFNSVYGTGNTLYTPPFSIPKSNALDEVSVDNPTDQNLLLREMSIGTVHVTAVTSSVVVYMPENINIRNTKQSKKIGQGCYVVPICEYNTSMGRACWVYSTIDKIVYFHPCKILTMNPSGICYEPQFIPNNKNLQDYANSNNHLILLGVLIIAHM